MTIQSLSQVSAKINSSYEMRIFGKKTKHDLELIKLLRNGFAHSMVPIKFTDDAVAPICTGLSIINTSAKSEPLNIMNDDLDENDPRTRFVIVCYPIV